MLRGKPTIETVEVDPTGKQVGEPIKVVPGSVGHDVYLTIDARIQKASEDALAAGITARAHATGHIDQGSPRVRQGAGRRRGRARYAGRFGRRDGEQPCLPAVGAGPAVSASRRSTSSARPSAHNPLLNRATEGLYAPGSAFKLVTAVASTRDGVRRRVRALPRHRQLQDRQRPAARPTTVASRTARSICSGRWRCRATRTSIPSATSCGTGGAPAIRNGLGIQQVAPRVRLRFQDGYRAVGSGRSHSRPEVEAGVRQGVLQDEVRAAGQWRLVSRRQRAPRGRPGRHARHAVAARRRLRGDSRTAAPSGRRTSGCASSTR